jgi:hypothetical protein
MTDAPASSDADGVLVASVWRTAGEVSLVRLTMTRPEGEGETVRTVATSAEALACVEEWLGAREGHGSGHP